MALIGSWDKRCVVGRAGHSAKTKARRGREIDVLIFPFEGQAAGYSARRIGDMEEKCGHFCSPSGGFFCSRRKALQRSPAGLEVMAAGRRLCERRGYYCYKFHHLSRSGEFESGGGGVRFMSRLLFQFEGVISARREAILAGNTKS